MSRSSSFKWIPLLAASLVLTILRYQIVSWSPPTSDTSAHDEHAFEEINRFTLSRQAQQNLDLVAGPLTLSSYWKKILIPGEIVDRPGISDRGVTAPAVGVVTQVHAFPGDMVRPGDRLFTLRLISEYIQNTQSELFKATKETELISEQRDRLARAAQKGGIAEARLIELDQQLRRQQAAIQSYRQDLLTRGLAPEQLESVAAGKFVSTIEVNAPPAKPASTQGDAVQPVSSEIKSFEDLAYEVQDLKVDLGMQVQAGQVLGVLANHQLLYVAGHAFKRESSFLERAAKQSWPIEIEFAEDDSQAWPQNKEPFHIRHLANAVDPTNRTFDFFVPLMNQSRTYSKSDRTYVVWRYRPGQRVRLHVPIEELKDVIVIPSSAVVREGPEAYVFRKRGDEFERQPVRVLHEDRLQIVIARDSVIDEGIFIAKSSAASLNRVLKSQVASGAGGRHDEHDHGHDHDHEH